MEQLNFCYICNNHHNHWHDNYFFNQLEKSITTLCKYYQNINKLYIFVDNTCQFDFTYIKEITKNIDLIIKPIDLNITNIFNYPINNINKDKINRIGLLKFLIPYLVDVDKIIYTDCDVLFYKNITDELNQNINDYIFKIYNENSGFIYFNCKLWRNNKEILNDIINYYNDNYLSLKYVDNDMFVDLIKKYSFHQFNQHININIKNEIEYTNVNIIHFMGWFNEKKNFDNTYTKIMKN